MASLDPTVAETWSRATKLPIDRKTIGLSSLSWSDHFRSDVQDLAYMPSAPEHYKAKFGQVRGSVAAKPEVPGKADMQKAHLRPIGHNIIR